MANEFDVDVQSDSIFALLVLLILLSAERSNDYREFLAVADLLANVDADAADRSA